MAVRGQHRASWIQMQACRCTDRDHRPPARFAARVSLVIGLCRLRWQLSAAHSAMRLYKAVTFFGVAQKRFRMPLYELLCLTQPLLRKQELQRMISKVGGMVYTQGGVITGVQSYGEQDLAYKIKGVQDKFDKAHVWQLDFAVSPQALDQIKAEMRNNENVLRWAVVKRDLPKLPSHRTMFHKLSQFADTLKPPPKYGQQSQL